MTGLTVAVIDPDGGLRQVRTTESAVSQLVAGDVDAAVEMRLHPHLNCWHTSHGGDVNVVAAALGRTFGVDLAVTGPVVVAGGRDDDTGQVRGLTGEQLAGLAVVCRFWSERAVTVPETPRPRKGVRA